MMKISWMDKISNNEANTSRQLQTITTRQLRFVGKLEYLVLAGKIEGKKEHGVANV